MSDARSKILFDVGALVALLDAGAPLVLLDVRDDPATGAVDRARIPGAILVDLATDFSGPPSASQGKRPLPDIAALQARARRWGVTPDATVVVYDDAGGAQAARAWWTLRWAGVDAVRLLDGGLRAWTSAGRSTSQETAPLPSAGTIVLTPGHMPTIKADEAARLAREAVLLDARGRAAYLGQPDDAATGHIPGALSAPAVGNLDPSGHFKATQDLRAGFASAGVDGSVSVGVYCGSGNAAAHAIAALNAAGLPASLYVGSWSAWSADPARPVTKGPERGL